jgi:tryptophan halogenase
MELYTMGEKVMQKKVVVVGGGSAGWLTALMAKKSSPDIDVTVIESEEIGILGAGESSVPALIQFFRHLGISVPDLVKNCDATIKNAIKFTNWNNDNDFYYHGFLPTEEALGPYAIPFKFLSTSPMQVSSLVINNGLKEIEFSENISEQNKVPFIFKSKQGKNPMLDYENIGTFSLHINATKLANRLKEIGIDRGISVIEGIVKEVSLDSNNYVDGLILENGSMVSCDFVFDCSGFHRLIIGKIFKSKWKSYKEFLPSDSAIPFFIDMTEEIPPYTECIAMKYGWMWKIPLQSRFGCGYVYDSSLISEKEAIEEVEEFLGFEPHYPRKEKGGFSFNAGSYEEPWINNCVAIGLAANFIEPLEATSLWTSTSSLIEVFANPNWISNNSKEVRDEFNKFIVSLNEEIVTLLYLHYMSLRKDTDFWKKFSYEGAPEQLKQRLEMWKVRLPNKNDVSKLWAVDSWITIASAQNTMNKSLAKSYLEYSEEYQKGIDTYDHFINYQNYKISQCLGHREFLESLK